MEGAAVSAADALHAAQAAGISVDLDGEDLVLQGPAPPPPALLEVLSAYKAEIVEVLRARSPEISYASNGSAAVTGSKWWHDLSAERSVHHMLAGRRQRAEAERLVWAEMQNRWHVEHGERVPRDICAGCRRSIGSAAALDLIDGCRVHLDDENVCLIRHGKRWRAAATRALAELGLRPPSGVECESQ
jgi:hypothetical protein